MEVSDCILLSIQPTHARRIYAGDKRAELRKSFPSSARIVFLYETSPTSSITGAFIVQEAVQTGIPEAVIRASAAGVDPERALTYYGQRNSGWVVMVGVAIEFDRAFPLTYLRGKDHYFSPPQTFRYLSREEGITQELFGEVARSGTSRLVLEPLDHEKAFSTLVKREVGSSYDDIDDDFVRQIINPAIGRRAAFSTLNKYVLQARLANVVIGYTVLTEKKYGAWKSGPTILLPDYRGFGLAQALRRSIRIFCQERHALSIYCTCADSKPSVVSYLLNAGMAFQARLSSHLADDRDELVFAERLRSKQVLETHPRVAARVRKRPLTCARIRSSSRSVQRVIEMFVRYMPKWYFPPDDAMSDAILASLRTFESDERVYSAKPRALYALLEKGGAPQAALLATLKRSNMAKLNIVCEAVSEHDLSRLLQKALSDLCDARRVYLTVPASALPVLSATIAAGFRFEGLLQDPFGTGSDHVCLGLVRQRS